ncbi:MAG: divalent-cation tolerance protein CutA [Thermoguttaceae bacterium]|nr:divalent-cation tolerance protein CutA [Thermoguttaceae bacterium]
MTKYVQIQTTFPSFDEAQNAAAFLVDSKLAACAQIVPDIQSRYVWLGKSCVDNEFLLLCKTRVELFERVVSELAARHSYECPQIVGVPLEFVSDSYAKWLDESILND